MSSWVKEHSLIKGQNTHYRFFRSHQQLISRLSMLRSALKARGWRASRKQSMRQLVTLL